VTLDERQLSALIGEIYDAALNQPEWVDVLAKIAHFVGGSAACLFAGSAGANAIHVYGTDPRYRQLYLDHYKDLDPATSRRLSADVDEPFAAEDVIPYHEFLATRFYREWAQPQQLVDFLACVLDGSMTSPAMIRVFRHERDGLVDEPARERMRLIAPHVRRSVIAGRLSDRMTAETATYIDVLDRFTAGMFLVDAGARIVHANSAGRAVLTAGEVLRSVDGRVVAGNKETDKDLRNIFANAGTGDDVSINGVAVSLTTRTGEHYVAHALPLTLDRRRRGGARKDFPVAALFVRKAAMEVPSPPEIIAKTYRLTRAELRVLLALVELGNVPQVARGLGLAASTVRTHIENLYKKTGAGRHADLVKLVVGFCNPLVS